MQIGSKTLAPPKLEIATPPAAAQTPRGPAVVPQQLQTGFEAMRSNPVNLSGTSGVVHYQQSGGAGASNPAGNAPQAWGNTCGPNTIMAMEASVDPARAEELSGMTGDERAEYEAAVMNSNPGKYDHGFTPGPNTDGGWGYTEMSRHVQDRFGGLDPASGNNYASDQAGASEAMVTALEDGRPVAIGLEDHWMAATDVRTTEDGVTEVLIHDSWTGTSAWVPADDIAAGNDWVSEYFPGLPSGSTIEALAIPSTDSLNPDSLCRNNEAAALETVQEQQGNWTRRELPEQTPPGNANQSNFQTFRFNAPIPI